MGGGPGNSSRIGSRVNQDQGRFARQGRSRTPKSSTISKRSRRSEPDTKSTRRKRLDTLESTGNLDEDAESPGESSHADGADAAVDRFLPTIPPSDRFGMPVSP